MADQVYMAANNEMNNIKCTDHFAAELKIKNIPNNGDTFVLQKYDPELKGTICKDGTLKGDFIELEKYYVNNEHSIEAGFVRLAANHQRLQKSFDTLSSLFAESERKNRILKAVVQMYKEEEAQKTQQTTTYNKDEAILRAGGYIK
jgi:hypothetical protein